MLVWLVRVDSWLVGRVVRRTGRETRQDKALKCLRESFFRLCECRFVVVNFL